MRRIQALTLASVAVVGCADEAADNGQNIQLDVPSTTVVVTTPTSSTSSTTTTTLPCDESTIFILTNELEIKRFVQDLSTELRIPSLDERALESWAMVVHRKERDDAVIRCELDRGLRSSYVDFDWQLFAEDRFRRIYASDIKQAEDYQVLEQLFEMTLECFEEYGPECEWAGD